MSNNYPLVLGYVRTWVKPVINDMFENGDCTPGERGVMLRELNQIRTFRGLVSFSKEKLGMQEYEVYESIMEFLDQG